MANSELQLEMAMRDQVIQNQRESLKNLWNLLMGLGLDEKQILHLAAKQGLTIEGWTTTPSLGLLEKQSSNLSSSRSTSVGPSSGIEYLYAGYSFTFLSMMFVQIVTYIAFIMFLFCREGNQNSCDFPCPDFSPPAYSRVRNVDAKPNTWFGSPEKHFQDPYKSYLDMTSHASHNGSCMSSSSVVGDLASSRR